MPCDVEKQGSKWPIVDNESGEVKGKSDTKTKAQASCNARNAAAHGWKPTRRRSWSELHGRHVECWRNECPGGSAPETDRRAPTNDRDEPSSGLSLKVWTGYRTTFDAGPGYSHVG